MPIFRQVFPLLVAVPLACIPPPLEGCADAAACDAAPVSTGELATSTTTTGGASLTSDATAITGQGGEATGDALTGGGTTGSGTTGSSTDATTGDASTSGTGSEALPPKVLAVDMPAKVSIAGPVSFTATTEHAASAHAKLDGVDLGPLTDEGSGIYSGIVSIFDTQNPPQNPHPTRGSWAARSQTGVLSGFGGQEIAPGARCAESGWRGFGEILETEVGEVGGRKAHLGSPAHTLDYGRGR